MAVIGDQQQGMPPEKGAGLLEALVAFGVLGIVAVSVSHFYANNQRLQHKMRVRSVQETIAADVEAKLKSATSIYISLLSSSNKDLLQCIEGVGTGCSSKLTTVPTIPTDRNKFALLYPTGANQYQAISSVPGKSVYYNTKGQVGCTASDRLCIFEVETFFYATCPISDDKSPLVAAPSTCNNGNGAAQIHLGYEVKQTKPYNASGVDVTNPSIPKRTKFFSLTGHEILAVGGNNDCNQGAAITGYSYTGKPICQCRQPFIQAVQNGTQLSNRRGPLCNPTTDDLLDCADGEVYVGLQADGTPRCEPFSSAYDCYEVGGSLDSKIDDYYQGGGDCGSDYWLAGHVRENCRFYCAMGGGGGICGVDEDKEKRTDYIHRERDIDGLGDIQGEDRNRLEAILAPGASLSDSKIRFKDSFVCHTSKYTCCRPVAQ